MGQYYRFQIKVKNMDTAICFYSNVFPNWNITTLSNIRCGDYATIEVDGNIIGYLDAREFHNNQGKGAIPFFTVTNLTQTIGKIEEFGGMVVWKPSTNAIPDIDQTGILFLDNEGNLLGIVEIEE